MLIDANLKAWLIEVNSSPSMTDTTIEDKILKKDLINDVFNIVIPGDWLTTRANVGTNTCRESKVGSFEVLFDESTTRAKSASGTNSRKPMSANSRTGAHISQLLSKKRAPYFR